MVATTAFKDAARAQGEALGFEPAIVWVAHPIQNRSRQELRRIAEAAIVPILAHLGQEG